MSNWTSYKTRFKQYLQLERSLSKNSIEAYADDINKLEQYSQLELNNRTPVQIELTHLQAFVKWISEMGFSATSQARIISGLKSFYGYLLLEKEVKTDPLELIDTPRIGRHLPDVLSVQEMEDILGAIDLSKQEGTRNRAMLEMLYSCGLRVSELTEVRISCLHASKGFLRVIGKGNKERLVPIGSTALKWVTHYLEQTRNHQTIKPGQEDFLFLNRRGSKLSRMMVFTIIREQVQKLGIQKQISPHTFRHSFAMHLLEDG